MILFHNQVSKNYDLRNFRPAKLPKKKHFAQLSHRFDKVIHDDFTFRVKQIVILSRRLRLDTFNKNKVSFYQLNNVERRNETYSSSMLSKCATLDHNTKMKLISKTSITSRLDKSFIIPVRDS